MQATRRRRRATPDDAAAVARLLHDFNTEFSAPIPGTQELESRLTQLLAGNDVVVLLTGEDTDARRFYETHGFISTEAGRADPMLYYYREL